MFLDHEISCDILPDLTNGEIDVERRKSDSRRNREALKQFIETAGNTQNGTRVGLKHSNSDAVFRHFKGWQHWNRSIASPIDRLF
jgi:hypothetical protein